MPTMNVSRETLNALIAEARERGVTAKDVCDQLVQEQLGVTEETEEPEEEGEGEEEGSE